MEGLIPVTDLSLSPTLQKIIFSNGLTLLIQRRPGTRTVTVEAWIRVGSRYETESLNGISHFLEHMLFKGSSKYTGEEIRRKIRRVGGYLNGETFWEYTKYYTVVPANHLDTAIEVIGEMVMNSLLRPEDVDTERKVVLEEIKRFQDDPRLFALNIVTRTLFPGHPLGRPVIGTEKTVKNITHSQLVNFYQTHYTAPNIVLVIVGDLEPKEVIQLVGQKFSTLRSDSRAKIQLQPPPPQQAFRNVTIERLLFQAYVAVGIPTMGVQDPDRYVMDLINVILGSGKNSRIYQRIKEQEGLSDEIDSIYLPLSDIGAWGIYVGTSPNYLQRVQELIFQEFETLKNKPLSDKELEIAKQTLVGNFLIEREDNLNQADFYGWFETIHNAESMEEYLEKIHRISQEDIQRVARQYFQQNKYNLFIVKPVGGVKKVLAGLGYLF
jgi:predicted Zn-dependent peptidase